MPSRRIARALRHRNYRLFFAGQGTSLIGTWLTRFAMGLATFDLSHSSFQLGGVAFATQAPTALIAPFAGVLVDRWHRHRTLVITQVLAMLQSAALALYAITGWLTVWDLVWLGAIQAAINAFDMPARQSFVRQMVDDPADLPNAIALNSSLVNVARLLGPMIAAALVHLVGVGGCFAIDAASYVAVIASLLAMRIAPQPLRVRSGDIVHEMREGLAYVRGQPLVRALLVLLAVTSVFAGAYTSLLPAVASGAYELGWLMGAAGAGALVGVLYLAGRATTTGLHRLVGRCGVALGGGLAALELAPNVWVKVPILFVVGGALIVQWAASNTLMQASVDEDKLGRVMSLYAVTFFGGAPIGALVEGSLASLIGPIHTFALAGGCCIACSLLFRRSLDRTAPPFGGAAGEAQVPPSRTDTRPRT
jgi:MFS family permease